MNMLNKFSTLFYVDFRWIFPCLTLLFFWGFAPQTAQPPGLESAEPIGKFLNGQLPEITPGKEGETSYSIVPAYPNLTFTDPLVISPHPRENRLFVGSRQGLIEHFEQIDNISEKSTLIDLTAETAVVHDGGLLGLAFHPEFGAPGSPNSRFFYVFYCAKGPEGDWGPTVCLEPECFSCEDDASWYGSYLRLSRFTVKPNSLEADASSEVPLFNIRLYNGTHRGGGLTFGNDGFLYCTLGDQARYVTAQDIQTNFEGGVIRLDIDQQGGAISHEPRRKMGVEVGFPDESSGNGYFIPNTNPWLDEGGNLFEEFVYVGNRNPHRLSLDKETGNLWIGEVGQNMREEVNLLQIGGNGGWPLYEGSVLRNDPTCGNNTLQLELGTYNPPVADFIREETRSIIGGYVYRGSRFPELQGKFICGGHALHKLFTLSPNPDNSYTKAEFINFSPGSIITFGEDRNGELYMGRLSSSTPLYTFSAAPANPPAPRLLSETGAFKDLEALEPADGFIPYGMNQPFWSDGAEKFRWMAIPNDGSHDSPEEQIEFSESGDWVFPKGSVFIKHFELGGKRLETRFEVHGEDGQYYYMTYKWNEAQTEAELLDGALDETVTIDGINQVWHYPSSSECRTCHQASAGSTLGLRTRHLNGDYVYPAGTKGNQLVTLSHLGMIEPRITDANQSDFPTIAAIDDSSASLEYRARSYLDVNCAYCHQPGTGNRAAFDMRISTPLENSNLIYGGLLNAQGNADARLIVPQDPENSMVFHRMNSLDQAAGVAMPPLAKNVLDQEGLALVSAWIHTLTVEAELLEDTLITNGSAQNLVGGCTQLTPNIPEQAGSAWYPQLVDLSQDLSISFNLSLGLQDEVGEVDNGGDGVVFLFQQAGDTLLSRLDGGSGLGATGVVPSVGIEFDTYNSGTDEDIAEDHMTIFRNGVLGDAVAGPVCTKSDCSNTEDGEAYPVRIVWQADSQTLRVYFNEELRVSWTEDIVAGIFNGDSLVFIGITGAVGGAFNEQIVCNFQVEVGEPMPVGNAQVLDPHSGSIKIFPNPAHDKLWLSWEAPQPTLNSYSLYTLNGTLLRRMKLTSVGKHSAAVPVAEFPTGTYVIVLEDRAGKRFSALWQKR